MASSVRRLCLDATPGRYWQIGLVVRIFRMDLRHGEISRLAEARETDSRLLFITVPADRVLTPSCNRDRVPDLRIGADDVPKTTRLVAFDFASTRTGTLVFVEDAFITSSFESRMLNCRLSEKHLNRRAARLVDLATHHDKVSGSSSKRDVQESRVKYFTHPVSCRKYLCEVRPGRAQAHLPALPKPPRCHIEQPDARVDLDLDGRQVLAARAVEAVRKVFGQGCKAT